MKTKVMLMSIGLVWVSCGASETKTPDTSNQCPVELAPIRTPPVVMPEPLRPVPARAGLLGPYPASNALDVARRFRDSSALRGEVGRQERLRQVVQVGSTAVPLWLISNGEVWLEGRAYPGVCVGTIASQDFLGWSYVLKHFNTDAPRQEDVHVWRDERGMPVLTRYGRAFIRNMSVLGVEALLNNICFSKKKGKVVFAGIGAGKYSFRKYFGVWPVGITEMLDCRESPPARFAAPDSESWVHCFDYCLYMLWDAYRERPVLAEPMARAV